MRRLAWVLVAIALAAPVEAAQRRAKKLSAEDRLEIQALLTKYHWAADAIDGDGWADMFTEDGEYEVGQVKTKGRENLKALPKNAFGTATVKTPLHFVTNIWVEPSPEGARGGAYMLMATPGGGKGVPITINAIVVYEDVLVKTSEGWRIKSRKTHTTDAGLAPSLLWNGRPR